MRARLSLALDRPQRAAAVEGALSPEVGEGLPRADVRLQRHGDRVVLHVDAEDATAMRAAVNAYLRWARTALDVTTMTRHDPGDDQ